MLCFAKGALIISKSRLLCHELQNQKRVQAEKGLISLYFSGGTGQGYNFDLGKKFHCVLLGEVLSHNIVRQWPVVAKLS